MRATRWSSGLAAVCWLALASAGAYAQFDAPARPFAGEVAQPDIALRRYQPRVPQAPQARLAPRLRGINQRQINDINILSESVIGLGDTTRNVQKPFANVEPAPTVSPYLNLARDDEDLTLPTYQTLVRPFVRQREVNEQQQMEIQQLNQQFSNVRNEFQIQQQRGYGIRPTGHSVRFMNLAPYYPTPR